MAKVHWQKTADYKTACGRQGCATVPLTMNAQDVDCKACLKLLPQATLTIWDRILNEDAIASVPEKPKRVRKPRVKPDPVPPEIIVRRAPRRQEAMLETFATLYGVERKPASTEWQDPDQWSPWRGIAIGSVLILAMLAWTLGTAIYAWLTK